MEQDTIELVYDLFHLWISSHVPLDRFQFRYTVTKFTENGNWRLEEHEVGTCRRLVPFCP